MSRATQILLAVWLVIAAFVVFLFAALVNSRQFAEQAVRDQAVSYARLVEQHASAAFERVNTALLGVSDHVRTIDLISADQLPDARRKKLEAFLHTQQERTAGVISMSVSSADGTVLASSVATAAPLHLGGRGYFLTLKSQRRSTPVVSEALLGLGTKRWAVHIARRIDLPDGRFGGAVGASLDLFENFSDFYSTLSLGKDSTVSLRDEGDRLLVRYPMIEAAMGKPAVLGGLAQRIAAREPEGTVTISSSMDHVERLFAFRKLPKFPIYAIVGLSLDDAYSSWRRERDATAIIALLAILAGTFATIVLRRKERAEVKLAVQSHRFQMFLRAASDGIHVLDADGNVQEANEAFCSMLGYTRDEVLRMNVAQWDARWAPQELHRRVRQATETVDQGAKLFETKHRRRDGCVIDVEISSIAVELDGEPLLFCAARDITERLRTEHALHEIGERFHSVVNHVIDGIITIDDAGRIESFNPAAERLFGYTAEEVISQSVSLLMDEPDRSKHDGYVANWASGGKSQIIGIGREVVGLRKDGSTFPMELAVSTFELQGRRFATGIVRDITKRKRLEEQLRKHAVRLSEMNVRKDEFLAMLSHELRNPLAPILNAVHLLRLQEGENPVRRQARDIIERQLGHLSHLVNELLEVSRITTGRIRLNRERVAVNEVVEDAVEMVRPLIDRQRQRLTIAPAPEPIWLDADAARLKQVVVNLLNNAAKYTNEGGEIWLAVEQHGEECVLSVRDTGAGIAPELLPHIFDLFTQGERSLDRSQGGLGIGLAVVKRLVELHGGTVEAYSVLGQGSEFLVRLPNPANHAAQVPSIQTVALKQPRAFFRILVVDDNADMAESLAMLLQVSGHSVRTVRDGPSAVQAVIDYRPDVVVLDIGLPGLNGYEVAKQIRQQPTLKGVVLIAMTGYGQETDRQRSMEAGFDHHLVKPVDFEHVQQILATLSASGENSGASGQPKKNAI